jgi:hypothetical protein
MPQDSPPRRRLSGFLIVLILIGVALVFRRAGYFFERAALELRYFWWLALILGGGIWVLWRLGRGRK